MLVGLGQMLVITLGPGNIDLSIPYAIGLTGFIAMKTMNAADGNIAVGILAGLAVGAAIGAFNFGLIRMLRVPPMIATLASGFIVQTFSIVFFRGLQIKPPPGLAAFVDIKLGPLPLLFVLVAAIAVVMHFVLTRSPLRTPHPGNRPERQSGLARRDQSGHDQARHLCAVRSVQRAYGDSPFGFRRRRDPGHGP